MSSAGVTQEALVQSALRQRGPGVTDEQAVVLGFAELTGEPLDPWAFDDAAVLLRADTLLREGLLVAEALATAREERATWA